MSISLPARFFSLDSWDSPLTGPSFEAGVCKGQRYFIHSPTHQSTLNLCLQYLLENIYRTQNLKCAIVLRVV